MGSRMETGCADSVSLHFSACWWGSKGLDGWSAEIKDLRCQLGYVLKMEIQRFCSLSFTSMPCEWLSQVNGMFCVFFKVKVKSAASLLVCKGRVRLGKCSYRYPVPSEMPYDMHTRGTRYRTQEDLQPSEAVSGCQSRYSAVPKMPLNLHVEVTKSQFRRCMNAAAKLIGQLEQAEL